MARVSEHASMYAAFNPRSALSACLFRPQPQSLNHRAPVRDGQHHVRLMPTQQQSRRVWVTRLADCSCLSADMRRRSICREELGVG